MAKLTDLQVEYLKSGFQTSFQQVINLYQEMYCCGRKGTVRNVRISFLRTGVLLSTAWYQIDLLDEKDWGDIHECNVNWDIGLLAAQLTENPRDLQQADNVHRLLERQMGKLTKEHKAQLPNAQWWFGEYMNFYTKI